MKYVIAMLVSVLSLAWAQVNDVYFQTFPNDQSLSFAEVSQALGLLDEGTGLMKLRQFEGLELLVGASQKGQKPQFQPSQQLLLCFSFEKGWFRLVQRQGQTLSLLYPKEGAWLTLESNNLYCASALDLSSADGGGLYLQTSSEPLADLPLDVFGDSQNLPSFGSRQVSYQDSSIHETWLNYSLQTVADNEGECLSGVITLNYLQRIALSSEAQIVLRLSPCQTESSMQANEFRFDSQGAQVPFSIQVSCLADQPIEAEIWQHNRRMFSAVGLCQDWLNNEVILSMVTQ
ncbi:MAG: hypothetical protein R2880_12815 [Deinococcales bacterium]